VDSPQLIVLTTAQRLAFIVQCQPGLSTFISGSLSLFGFELSDLIHNCYHLWPVQAILGCYRRVCAVPNTSSLCTSVRCRKYNLCIA